jgi:hypothetical protein
MLLHVMQVVHVMSVRVPRRSHFLYRALGHFLPLEGEASPHYLRKEHALDEVGSACDKCHEEQRDDHVVYGLHLLIGTTAICTFVHTTKTNTRHINNNININITSKRLTPRTKEQADNNIKRITYTNIIT